MIGCVETFCFRYWRHRLCCIFLEFQGMPARMLVQVVVFYSFISPKLICSTLRPCKSNYGCELQKGNFNIWYRCDSQERRPYMPIKGSSLNPEPFSPCKILSNFLKKQWKCQLAQIVPVGDLESLNRFFILYTPWVFSALSLTTWNSCDMMDVLPTLFTRKSFLLLSFWSLTHKMKNIEYIFIYPVIQVVLDYDQGYVPKHCVLIRRFLWSKDKKVEPE